MKVLDQSLFSIAMLMKMRRSAKSLKSISLLRRNGLITDWHDRRISAGKDWQGEINTNLDKSQVILLLISADFLSSDYCSDVEMQRALEKHEAGIARVIPIIVRPVDFKLAPFAKIQALPKDAKAITLWSNTDEAWVDVTKGIRQVCEELQNSSGLSTPQHESEEPNGLRSMIQPVSVSFSFKRIEITSRLHRYGLVSTLRLNRPPAKKGFLLKLGWPEFIRITRNQGLLEAGRYQQDRTKYIEYMYEYKETLWPGQLFEIAGQNGKIEMDYEFDNQIWYVVDHEAVFLNWKVFFSDSMPVEGQADFKHLNIF